MYSRGYASDESMAAFARARKLALGVGDASERFDAYNGLFLGSMLRGELSLAQETAESFLREAENGGQMTEVAGARRCVGVARLYLGDFINARTDFGEVLRIYDPERDRDRFRFAGAFAAGYLAQASWVLGVVRTEIIRRSSSATLARMCNRNGARWAIKFAMNATSRDKRSSLATTTGHLRRRASASAAASTGRRSSASAPLPVSTSTCSPAISKPSASANRAMASRWASIPSPDLPCPAVLTRRYAIICDISKTHDAMICRAECGEFRRQQSSPQG
jgi:hypothetical protein